MSNHRYEQIIVPIERYISRLTPRARRLVNLLEGGCTAPIGAHAQIIENKVSFKAALFSLDGSQIIERDELVEFNHFSEINELGIQTAKSVLENGGAELMKTIKESLKS